MKESDERRPRRGSVEQEEPLAEEQPERAPEENHPPEHLDSLEAERAESETPPVGPEESGPEVDTN